MNVRDHMLFGILTGCAGCAPTYKSQVRGNVKKIMNDKSNSKKTKAIAKELMEYILRPFVIY